MAATFSAPQVRLVVGSEFYVEIQVTGDASYPNPAGYPVPASAFGFSTYATKPLTGAPVAFGSYTIICEAPVANYATVDTSTGNLRLFVASTGVEVANAVNVSTYTAVIGALGH